MNRPCDASIDLACTVALVPRMILVISQQLYSLLQPLSSGCLRCTFISSSTAQSPESYLIRSGLPDLIPTLTTAWPPSAVTIIFYWTPQVIGGSGFIVASVLLMEEEQRTWWHVAPTRIGWSVFRGYDRMAVWTLIKTAGTLRFGT